MPPRNIYPATAEHSVTQHVRSSPGLNLSLSRSGSDLIKPSAKRLDGMVGDWGSADTSRTLNLGSRLVSCAWGPVAGHPAGGCRGETGFELPASSHQSGPVQELGNSVPRAAGGCYTTRCPGSRRKGRRL